MNDIRSVLGDLKEAMSYFVIPSLLFLNLILFMGFSLSIIGLQDLILLELLGLIMYLIIIGIFIIVPRKTINKIKWGD